MCTQRHEPEKFIDADHQTCRLAEIAAARAAEERRREEEDEAEDAAEEAERQRLAALQRAAEAAAEAKRIQARHPSLDQPSCTSLPKPCQFDGATRPLFTNLPAGHRLLKSLPGHGIVTMYACAWTAFIAAADKKAQVVEAMQLDGPLVYLHDWEQNHARMLKLSDAGGLISCYRPMSSGLLFCRLDMSCPTIN